MSFLVHLYLALKNPGLPSKESLHTFLEELVRDDVFAGQCFILEREELVAFAQAAANDGLIGGQADGVVFRGRDPRELLRELKAVSTYASKDLAIGFEGLNWPLMQAEMEKIGFHGNGAVVVFALSQPREVELNRKERFQFALAMTGGGLGSSFKGSRLYTAFQKHLSKHIREFHGTS